ncbi:IS1 family transposase [Kluyvera chengduensis]|uniref:IS1 family transposase n=1 Tax=Kluyvera sp. 142359 TaxID=3375726 RepID=UPI003770DE70
MSGTQFEPASVNVHRPRCQSAQVYRPGRNITSKALLVVHNRIVYSNIPASRLAFAIIRITLN